MSGLDMVPPPPTWQLVEHEPLETMEEARAAADKLPPGRWKWAKSPGNGFSTAYRQCNHHVDCPCVVRIVQKKGSGFHLFIKGEHSSEVFTKKRKNSSLTLEESELVRTSVDMGNSPAEQLVALTKKELRRLKEEGEDVEEARLEEGGLAGR